MLETFQDRLVTELRLAGAGNIYQANEASKSPCPDSTTGSRPWRSSRKQHTGQCRARCR